MITVLHIIDTGGPGGAETVFLNTCAGLDTKSFRSVCIVSRDGWLTDSLRARGLEPVLVSASGSFNVRYLRSILQIVHRERVDVIAAHLYGSAVYGSLAGIVSRTPVVSVLHGQSDILGGGHLDSIKKLLVRHGSTRLVFVSDRLKKELAGTLGARESQCRVISNGVEIGKFAGDTDDSIRRHLGISRSDILVGAIGNIRKPKSYEVLLRAAQILRARSSRYHFIVAGEGGNSLHQQLLSLRSELGLDNVVTFLGLRTDVATVLHNLDVYALSSTTEGFSIACIEAMAAGIPVVATRSGGPEEIIEHEHTGLLVPTQDSAALAAAIARLAADRGLSTLLTRNARQRVQDRYTLRAMVEAYERLFSELTAGKLQ